MRDVTIPPWVAAELKPLLDTQGLLFPSMVYANWRKRIWMHAIEDAKLGHVRPHDCRHTTASWLIQDGVSLAEVGRMLGHVSPMTTQRYAHLADIPASTFSGRYAIRA